MIDESTIRLDREVFVASDAATDGDGSKSRPFRAPNGLIDNLFSRFGRSCKVTLRAGQYWTATTPAIPWRFWLQGEGMDATNIKLVDNARSSRGWPQIRMFSDWGSVSNLFIAKDLTLDGNWQGQPDAQTNGKFKLDCIVVIATKAKVENVRIKNFGSNGKDSGREGFECFPLSLSTYSAGPPLQYFPVYAGLKNDQNDWTYLEIKDCRAEGGNFIHGGYCTAIFMQTAQGPNGGDRQQFGARTTPAGLIHGCIVENVTGGIAYGAASSDQVVFRDNIATNCKAAFNFDTGEAQKLRIVRNQFLNCNQGIRFLPYPNSKDVEISRNVITLTEPYFNSILGDFEPWYGVSVNRGHISGLKVADNYIATVGSKPRRPHGIFGGGEGGNVLIGTRDDNYAV